MEFNLHVKEKGKNSWRLKGHREGGQRNRTSMISHLDDCSMVGFCQQDTRTRICNRQTV